MTKQDFIKKNYYENGSNLIYKLLDSKLENKNIFHQKKKLHFKNEEPIVRNFDINFSKMTLRNLKNPKKVDMMYDVKSIIKSSENSIDTEFSKLLVKNSIESSNKEREEIIDDLNNLFHKQLIDLNQLTEKDSFYLFKINHGFWEGVRYCYSNSLDERKFFFRPKDKLDTYKQRLKNSGIVNFLGLLISSYLLNNPSNTFHCLGLNTGTKESRFKELSPLNQSAAAGMIAFYKSIQNIHKKALGENMKIPFRDSECIKRLMTSDNYILEKILVNSDAIIFIGNRNLSKINSKHGGSRYFYQIPDQCVNENFFAVASGYIGLLDIVLRKHNKITVICEAAVCSVVLGFLTQAIFSKKQIRFLDFGRSLHFAREGFCEKSGFNKDWHTSATRNFQFET